MIKSAFFSNQLESLYETLHACLFRLQSAALEERVVIVPDRLASEDIRFFLAERGSLFGINFYTPIEAIAHLGNLQGKRIPSLQELSFHIYGLILSLEDSTQELSIYVGGDEKKRALLSFELSLLFQEQILEGCTLVFNEWQNLLWERLKTVPDLIFDLTAILPKKEVTFPLHFFNVTSLKKGLRVFFERLPALYYHLTPSDAYMGDLISDKARMRIIKKMEEKAASPAVLEDFSLYTQESHPLLRRFGFEAKAFISQIEDASIQENFFWDFPKTQLGALKRSFNDREEFSLKEDGSILLIPCQSRLFEVENLRSFIEKKLEENPDFSLEDIAVFAPQIEIYAPLIERVFNFKTPIPFTLSGSYQKESLSFADTLKKLLECGLHNFEKESVYAFLSKEEVMKTLLFEREDLLLFQSWMDTLFIDRGFSGEKKGSWEYALKELYTMLCKEGAIPFTESEKVGFWTALLHKMYAFLKPIIIQEKRTMAEWINYVREGAELFISGSQHFLRDLEYSLVDKNMVTFQSIEYLIIKAIESTVLRTKREKTGAVYFSSLAPLCSKRIIWILGLEEGSFPKTSKQSVFLEKKKTGQKEEFLFLQLLVLAKEQFVLSFSEVSQRDGKKIFPSECVEMIQTLLSLTPQKERNFIKIERKKPKIVSFALENKERKEKDFSLEQLQKIAAHPVRYFLHEKEGLSLFYDKRMDPFKLSQKNRLIEKTLLSGQIDEKTIPLGLFGFFSLEEFSLEIQAIQEFFKGEAFSFLSLEKGCKQKEQIRAPALTTQSGYTISGIFPLLSERGPIFLGKATLANKVRALPLILTHGLFTKKKSVSLFFADKGVKEVVVEVDFDLLLSQFLDYVNRATISPLMPEWASYFIEKDKKGFCKAALADLKGADLFPDPTLQWLFDVEEERDFAALYDDWEEIGHALFSPIKGWA